MHILIIEDDAVVGKHIQTMIEQQSWQASLVNSVAQALELLEAETFDLSIIDWMLPDGEGLEIVRWIRTHSSATPTLLLTAKTQTDDIVQGLEVGADDYLTKPFAMQELIARCQALLRRKGIHRSPVLEVADLRIDTNNQNVIREGQEIHLSPREYALLEYLAYHVNQTIDRLTLLHHVWGNDVDSFSNTVDVHIRYLRKKIDEPFASPLIHTIKQKGYVLCVDSPKSNV